MRYIKDELDEKVLMRCLLVMGQIGNVCGAVKHLVRDTTDLADRATTRKAHMLMLQTELADAILQLRRLASDLGFDHLYLEDLAERRYEERKREFAKAGKLDQWI